MKEQFAGRLVTIKPNFSTRAMRDKEGEQRTCVHWSSIPPHSLTHTPPARSLVSEVYRVGPTLKLVLLECDASFPSDLAYTTLHPMIVYIQIARQKVRQGGGCTCEVVSLIIHCRQVLQKLVKEMTANSRERQGQLDAAYRLYEDPVCPSTHTHTHTHTHRHTSIFLSSIPTPSRSVTATWRTHHKT